MLNRYVVEFVITDSYMYLHVLIRTYILTPPIDAQAQYTFMYDAILEGTTSGGTELPVDALSGRMMELVQMDRDGETGYQTEFNV